MANKAFAQVNTLNFDQDNHRFKFFIDIWADTPYGSGMFESDWFTLNDSGSSINAALRTALKNYAINTMGATFGETDTILFLGSMDPTT